MGDDGALRALLSSEEAGPLKLAFLSSLLDAQRA